MSEELRSHLYKSFNAKDTEELLAVWQTNNRVEWSDLTFEVIDEILKKRIGELPAQNDPILKYSDQDDDFNENDDLEEWEARLLDNENQPELYDTLEVLNLKNNINKVAKAVVIVNVIYATLNFQTFQGFLFGVFPSLDEIPGVLMSLFVTILGTGINIALVYFPLKALVHILRILMEMEFNSRKK